MEIGKNQYLTVDGWKENLCLTTLEKNKKLNIKPYINFAQWKTIYSSPFHFSFIPQFP